MNKNNASSDQMLDYSDGYYSVPRDWMKRMRTQKNKSWEWIESKSKDHEWLRGQVEDNGWPENPESYMPGLISEIQKMEKERIEIKECTLRSTIGDSNLVNNLTAPTELDSCWKLYRESVEKKYDNIETIEVECLNILNRISSDTKKRKPVKGLVVGYVQSGKTANMAGLISMAADYGWNLFIILSGTIENLRIQNRDRLYRDLTQPGCRLIWNRLDHVDPNDPDQNPSTLNLSTGSSQRYLTVCLKNKTRLTNLLRWLNADPNKKSQMRILLIDDEADQGSINTAKTDSRTTINRLIVNIVEGRDEKGNEAGPYQAMNYISYTATPYANFLSDGTPDSLYPRNFVTLLTPSKLYIGPVEIFGAEDSDREGLGVIGFPNRDSEYGMVDVSEDIDASTSLFLEEEGDIPQSLKDAVCWFLCCCAIQRTRGYRKPVSMLVNTSTLTENHKIFAEAINSYLNSSHEQLIADCARVYKAKTKEFPKSFFLERLPDYGKTADEILDYPSFEDIRDTISEYLNYGVKHISLDKDNRKSRFVNGIHICIDNGTGDVLDDSNPGSDEYLVPRLLYPNEEQLNNELEPAPAFIVVGGSTLSRGLTIEGLVSTFFARKVSQGDTLMQIGRWFGYRIGYELLPRIWMSPNSYLSFTKLIDVDESLRDFIRKNYKSCTPEAFPPIVQAFPKTGYLRHMTPPSKSRAAVPTEYNFEGTAYETTTIISDTETLEHNLCVTSEFLKSLGKPEKSIEGYDLVWRGIDREDVFEGFLSPFSFYQKDRNFNELDEMMKWVSSNCPQNWNVILAGVEDSSLGTWVVSNEVSINKVGRSAFDHFVDKDLNTGEVTNSVYIKSLSSPIDKIADLSEQQDPAQRERLRGLVPKANTEWRTIRNDFGLNGIPALIIYCISAHSPAKKGRTELGVERDLIGVVVIMPGIESSKRTIVGYQIPQSDLEESDDGDPDSS